MTSINAGSSVYRQRQRGDGDDTITINTAFAGVSGNDGYDRVYINGTIGTPSNLTTAGIEYISGGSGDDSFDEPQQSVDLTIDGNLGNDVLRGGNFNDYIYGDNGNKHTLYGNGGNDRLYGGTGRDIVYGGSGDDTVRSGTATIP